MYAFTNTKKSKFIQSQRQISIKTVDDYLRKEFGSIALFVWWVS